MTDVSKLEGQELDEAVAKALGIDHEADCGPGRAITPYFTVPAEGKSYFFRPSSSWHDGGPIIEHERISIGAGSLGGKWMASHPSNSAWQLCDTPLIAAMRAYVASQQ